MWQNEEAEVEEEWAEAGSSIKKREMAMAEEEGEWGKMMIRPIVVRQREGPDIKLVK